MNYLYFPYFNVVHSSITVENTTVKLSVESDVLRIHIEVSYVGFLIVLATVVRMFNLISNPTVK